MITVDDVIASGVCVSGVLANIEQSELIVGTQEGRYYSIYVVLVSGENKSILYDNNFQEATSLPVNV